VAACEFGWVAAEVGRQPWLVYPIEGVFEGLRTADAISPTVSAGEIMASLVMFSIIYLLLGGLYFFLMYRESNRGPKAEAQEG